MAREKWVSPEIGKEVKPTGLDGWKPSEDPCVGRIDHDEDDCPNCKDSE